MNVQEFEVTVRVAITKAIERGCTIRDGVTVDSGYCCPIGALFVANATPSASAPDFREIAKRFCGLTSDQAFAFVSGFDGLSNHWDADFYHLGKKLRGEFVQP